MTIIDDLKTLVSHHAGNLSTHLSDIKLTLGQIALNTRTEESHEAVDKKSDAAEVTETVAEIQLVPREGQGWKVIQLSVAQTKSGSCAVYLNSIAARNLIAGPFTGTTSEKQHFYVPPNALLVFHFYEQENGKEVSCSIQVERLIDSTAEEAAQGADTAPGLYQPRETHELAG